MRHSHSTLQGAPVSIIKLPSSVVHPRQDLGKTIPVTRSFTMAQTFRYLCNLLAMPMSCKRRMEAGGVPAWELYRRTGTLATSN